MRESVEACGVTMEQLMLFFTNTQRIISEALDIIMHVKYTKVNPIGDEISASDVVEAIHAFLQAAGHEWVGGLSDTELKHRISDANARFSKTMGEMWKHNQPSECC